MALGSLTQTQPAIFLSASIPTADRDQRYFETADVIAIRDCIKALVAAMIPKFLLVWGGHPSITPMIRLLAESNPTNVSDHFLLYQSSTFRNIAPKDNQYFKHIIWVPDTPTRAESLSLLREKMLSEPSYVAAVFVGGMEGSEEEFLKFHSSHPTTPVFPVATTGGAAKILYDEWSNRLSFPEELKTETAYPYLWHKLLTLL
jgi:SLOG cluster3 family